MISFNQWVDSWSISMLFVAINVAIATTIIATLALIISRLRIMALPVRHAFCVCGVAGAIVTPLFVLSLERWAPGLAEISVSDWPARKRTNSELTASQQALTQNVTVPHIPFVDHTTTESDVIDVTTLPGSINDFVSADSEHSTTTVSLNISESSANVGNERIDYRLILGKVLMLAWLIGSVVYSLRRVVAEIHLRQWLVTCNPIADVETLHAAQSAAFFVGLNEQSPLRRLAVQFRLRRWTGRRSQIAEAETLEAVQSAATGVGLNERPFLMHSKLLPAPVVCGLLYPKLVLPETMANGVDGLSHEQLVAVLTHEMAHLARRDLVTSLCLTVARIFYWWNPLVRALCSRIEDMGEQICDDIATASLSQPREYATALLHFAERSTNIPQQAASLGLSISTVSQLEIRIRRILHSTRSKCLRVSATAGVIVVLMATIVSAAASMIQIREAADNKSATENNAAKPAIERPSLDELLAKIGALENAYVPFQISVNETMRANEQLTPEQLNGVRYADGREHKRLMEHGVLARKVWFRSETSQIDQVKERTYLSLADGKRNVQAQPNEAPGEVYIDESSDRLMWFASNSPLMGIVPFSTRGDGDMFMTVFRDGKCKPTLTWDGDNAVLEFSLGEPQFRSEYRWTFSRGHNWHPVRLKTWLVRNEIREQISDWLANGLAMDRTGIWRVEKGSIGYFSWGEKPRLTDPAGEPIPYYWVDFVVESAAYGDAVVREKFKYEIPKDAKIRMADNPNPKPKMPAILEDRELLITVVNAKDEPVVDAMVRTSTGGHELEVLTTNDSGQVTSKKRGTESVSIQTEALLYRPTTMGVGGAPPTLKIMLMPITKMTVVDEDGKPLSGVFVGKERFASMSLEFDRNGFPIGPNLNFGRDPKEDRTDDNGHFQLANDITLRTLEPPVPIWAVSDSGDLFGWTWVPPGDLDQQQMLVVKRTAFVEAAFMIKHQTREKVYSWSLLDGSGFRIAGVVPNVSSFGANAFCNLRFRLPPGDYFLRREIPNGNPATSVLGFKVESDQTHVDLGLVDELSDGIAIDIDSEWGSAYGRIQVTNPDNLDLRPGKLHAGGMNPNFPLDVFKEDLLVDPQSGGLEGAFVYLAKAPATIHPEAARVPVTPLIVDQPGGRFAPHLMIVRVGQAVECVNTSAIATSLHNYPLKNQAVNMIVRPLTNPGAGLLWTPKLGESLPMKVASDLHPWMQAYWLVLDHSYAAITDKQGRFFIENLPPGKHVFRVWHERVGYVERKLEVLIEPGQITAQPTITIQAATLMDDRPIQKNR